MDEIFPPTNDGGDSVEPISSIASLDRALVHLRHNMQEITKECTLGGVTFRPCQLTPYSCCIRHPEHSPHKGK